MTATRPCIISTARSPPAPARDRRPQRRRQVDAVSRARRHPEAAGGLDRISAASTSATSPICRRSPISTAPSRSRVTISSPSGCGARPDFRRHRARPRAPRSSAAIAAVGLTGFEHRPIGTLSGGQMQRMLFARVLLQDADIILLDEPFTAIDATHHRRSAGAGAALARRGAHGGGGAARHRDGAPRTFRRRCCWRARPVAWGATAEVLTAGQSADGAADVEAFDSSAAACAATPCRRARPDRRCSTTR